MQTILLISLFLISPLQNQLTKTKTMKSIPEGVVEKNSYVLGPGDELEVDVGGLPNFYYSASVDLNGYLEVNTQAYVDNTPVLEKAGLVKVSGLTISEAESLLLEEYKKLYKNPQVTLRLLNARRFRLAISGAVRNPGIYEMSPLDRLSEIIIAAGGFEGGAAISRIKLGKRTIDFSPYIKRGDLKSNPFLLEKMDVYVPTAEKAVRVRGCVRGHPVLDGPPETQITAATDSLAPLHEYLLELLDGETVKDVLEKAGGRTTYTDINSLYVIRDGEKIKATLDTELRDGDQLIVGTIPIFVYVTGEVKFPGAYPYRPGLKVLDYVSLAGGPTERGKKHYFVITRQNGENFKAKLDDGVERGDKIEVVRISFMWWEDYLKVLTSITTLIVTWITITK